MADAAFVGDTWRFSQSDVIADLSTPVLMEPTTPGLVVQVSVTLNNEPWGFFTPDYDTPTHRWSLTLELPGPGKVAVNWLFTYGDYVKQFVQSISTQDRLPLVSVVGQSNLAWDTGPTGPAGPEGVQGMTGPMAGTDKQIIFNDGGVAAGNANATFDKTLAQAFFNQIRSVNRNIDLIGMIRTDASYLFYDFGGGNWAGMGTDVAGNIFFRVGTVGSDGTIDATLRLLSASQTTQMQNAVISNLGGGGNRGVYADNNGSIIATIMPQPGSVTWGQLNVLTTWLDMPAALTGFLGTGASTLVSVDLTRAKEFRLCVYISGAGVAGSRLRATDAAFLDLGTVVGAGDVSIAASGLTVGPWSPLRAAVQIDPATVAVAGIGGNGLIDPSFGQLRMEYR